MQCLLPRLMTTYMFQQCCRTLVLGTQVLRSEIGYADCLVSDELFCHISYTLSLICAANQPLRHHKHSAFPPLGIATSVLSFAFNDFKPDVLPAQLYST